jgi:hypothetical protein
MFSNTSAEMIDNTVAPTLPCQSCGKQTDYGLRFCLNCGAAISNRLQKVAPAHPAPQPCPQCTTIDEDSISFCVNCGTKFAVLPLPPPVREAQIILSGTQPSTEIPNPERLPTVEKAKKPAAKTISPMRIACAILVGSIVGVCAYIAAYNDFVQPQLEPYSWKGKALVLYAQPAPARITLTSEENRLVAIAQLPLNGKLALQNLPAGKYILSIESASHRKLVGTISLSADAPTVIGFPKPLQLPLN